MNQHQHQKPDHKPDENSPGDSFVTVEATNVYNNKILGIAVAILSFLGTSLGTWIAYQTWQNSVTLNEVVRVVAIGKEQRLASESANFDEHRRITSALASVVVQRQYDIDMLDIRARLVQIETRLTAVELAASEIRIKTRDMK